MGEVEPKARREDKQNTVWALYRGILYIADGEGHEREVLQRLNNRVQERWS